MRRTLQSRNLRVLAASGFDELHAASSPEPLPQSTAAQIQQTV
jgi:hypothetical protein